MTDDMELDTECPGRAVTVLEVSLETSDNGRGMNSSVSENPTLLRAWGLATGWDSGTPAIDSLLGISPAASDLGEGAESDVAGTASGVGKSISSGNIAGLDGALFPRRLWLGEGRIMEARSWLEIAADLL